MLSTTLIKELSMGTPGPDPTPIAERLPRYIDRSAGPDKCWPWTGSTLLNGYGRFRVGSHRDGSRRQALAHRLVMEVELGRELTPDEVVCHHCDNRPCCNPSHLYIGTPADNVQDWVERGDGNRGESNGQSKLTEDQVRSIRSAYAEGGWTQSSLAGEYGVSQTTIGLIINRKAWRHIQ